MIFFGSWYFKRYKSGCLDLKIKFSFVFSKNMLTSFNLQKNLRLIGYLIVAVNSGINNFRTTEQISSKPIFVHH